MSQTWSRFFLLALCLTTVIAEQCKNEEKEEAPLTRFPLTVFDWEEVKNPLSISLWLIVASIAKIALNAVPHLTEMFPDSALLIMIGLIIGIFFQIVGVSKTEFFLESHTFFIYLLPPLVFDAGYFMPARQFFDNLGSILTFALLGTTWNIVAMSCSLWVISLTGLFSKETPLTDLLLFGSVAGDVDPVAVIVIFEELGVNDVLFISVFGESILNDGVSVVFYRVFNDFTEIGASNLITMDYVNGFLAFFIVAIGGVLLGIAYAVVLSFITKFTRGVPILNPVFLIIMPYACYLTAEMLGLSSILAVVFCGVAMKMYVKENVPEVSLQSSNYFIKFISISSETVIFVFLGLSTVSSDHHWDSAFVVLTVVFALVYRTLGVVVMCFFLNKYRLNKFSKVDQFILAFGGLRGAIAYGLVVALPDIPAKQMFVTSVIVVIYFTVFLQGITLKPVAEFLQVEKKKTHKKNMTEHIYQELIDYTMSGMEDIAGFKGHHWLRDSFQYINKNYIKRLLVNQDKLKNMDNTKIVRMFKRLQMEDARNLVENSGDVSRNQVFVQALMSHTRSRTNTAAVGIPVSPEGFTANAENMLTNQGITIYKDDPAMRQRTATFRSEV